jgi:hypothetical protein
MFLTLKKDNPGSSPTLLAKDRKSGEMSVRRLYLHFRIILFVYREWFQRKLMSKP